MNSADCATKFLYSERRILVSCIREQKRDLHQVVPHGYVVLTDMRTDHLSELLHHLLDRSFTEFFDQGRGPSKAEERDRERRLLLHAGLYFRENDVEIRRTFEESGLLVGYSE